AATTEATQPAFAALHQDDDADKADRQENLDHADDGVDDLGHWESFGSRTVAAGFLNRLRWDFQRRFPVMDERVTQPSPGFGGAFWRGSPNSLSADHAQAAAIPRKSAAFRLAPPTRAPLTSGTAISSAAFEGFTEPP